MDREASAELGAFPMALEWKKRLRGQMCDKWDGCVVKRHPEGSSVPSWAWPCGQLSSQVPHCPKCLLEVLSSLGIISNLRHR